MLVSFTMDNNDWIKIVQSVRHFLPRLSQLENRFHFTTVPVQFIFPSPEYPSEHWHEYDPFEFLQTAC